MLLDLVHFRPVQPSLGIGRQSVGRRVDGLDIRHRIDSVSREGGTFNQFRPQRRWPCSLPNYQRECTTGANPFRGREKLIDEPVGIAAQVAQDTGLGDQDGVDRHAQLGGHGPGRHPVDDLPPECLPGGRLELGLDQLQQALQDVLVVLPIPAAAQVAGRVFQLVEHRRRYQASRSPRSRKRRDRQDWRRQLMVIVRSQVRNAPTRPLCWNRETSRTTTSRTSCVRSSASSPRRRGDGARR